MIEQYIRRISEDAPKTLEEVEEYSGLYTDVDLADVIRKLDAGIHVYDDKLADVTKLMYDNQHKYPKCCVWRGWLFDFSKWVKKFVAHGIYDREIYAFNKDTVRLALWGAISSIEEIPSK